MNAQPGETTTKLTPLRKIWFGDSQYCPCVGFYQKSTHFRRRPKRYDENSIWFLYGEDT